MPQLQHERCTVEGCGREHKARGYCQTHYTQWKRGVPIMAEIKVRERIVAEHCSEPDCLSPVKSKGLCLMHYARLLRHGHTKYPDRKRPPKTCSLFGCENHVYAKSLCHQHYIRQRISAKKYGVTLQQISEMASTQGAVCAICGVVPTKRHALSDKVMDFCVDHDHKTGVVRGLLCDRCNRAIGLLGDSPDILISAVLYLIRHSSAPDDMVRSVLSRLSEPLIAG